jgi:DNA-directed RNA polymerase subunit RPC12/RpoP
VAEYMALKNIACPDCGNVVSFTIPNDAEVTNIGSGGAGTAEKENCGNCGERVMIKYMN